VTRKIFKEKSYKMIRKTNNKCPISRQRNEGLIFDAPHDIKTAGEANFRNLFNGQSTNVENSFETIENIQTSLKPNQEDDLLRPINTEKN
jgi:hypothetical protein